MPRDEQISASADGAARTRALKSLCVFCGSAPGKNPAYLAAAKTIGTTAAQHGIKIVYGGGTLGLMGGTASSARDAGGEVFGVIPEFLTAREGILEGIEHVVVDTMHERKMRMYQASDAFCILPGGIGTLEELVETLSWARLRLHRKPIVLLNIEGYWRPLVELLTHVIDQGFAPPEFHDDWCVADTPEEMFKMAEQRLLHAVV